MLGEVAGGQLQLRPQIPELAPAGLVRDGDIIRVDATQGTLEALVPADVWAVQPDVKGWRIPAVFTGQRWTEVRRTAAK